VKAITIEPQRPGTARYEDFPEPDVHEGSVLVQAVAVGICGTDVEIVEGKYGWAPPGKSRLVLGHESLGRIIDPGLRGFRMWIPYAFRPPSTIQLRNPGHIGLRPKRGGEGSMEQP
jgi:threonine dehydrogenase-like Zn-dependent dehydrogenase